MIHENIELTGSFIVSGSFVLPSHPNTGSVTALTGSMYHDTTDNVLKVYTGNSWVTVGEQTASAAPASGTDIEYLLVAGGAGGGIDQGGGGGAGGFLSSSLASVTSGSSFTVTVGGGGAGNSNLSNRNITSDDGTDSSIAGASISTITATGGGGGAGGQNVNGASGGSGGGCSSDGAYSTTGGAGTVGQGFDGGDIGTSSSNRGGGGGGGASAAGQDSQGSLDAGDGGNGKQSNITGTATYYAGGGGGGAGSSTNNSGSGGLGGGGNGGGNGATSGTTGTTNTGGGGGGGSGTSPAIGAAGGSGVAIFAYDSGSFNCAGGIVGDTGNGRKYHQFNASDIFKVGSTSDFQIVTTNLVSHFDAGDFASRGTSTWTDLTGNGHNLTATSSPSLGSNFYYDLSSGGPYFTKSDSAHEFSDNNFTLEAWVKWDSFTYDTVASKRGTGNPGTRNWIMGHGASGEVYFIKYHNSSQYTYPTSANGVITTGSWYHYVVTGNGTTMTIYINASSVASTSFVTTGVYGSNAPLEIGRRGTNSGYQYLDGQVAQFRAYSSGLSATQVLKNYNATKTNFV